LSITTIVTKNQESGKKEYGLHFSAEDNDRLKKGLASLAGKSKDEYRNVFTQLVENKNEIHKLQEKQSALNKKLAEIEKRVK
jgi:predicted transcriptional regulator